MDGWLCGDCKSLNTPRAKSCYRCNVPRRFGEAGADVTSSAIVRTSGERASTPGTGAASTPSTAAGGRPGAAGVGGSSGGAGAAGPAPEVPPPGAARAAAERGRPPVSDARSSRWRGRAVVLLLALSTAWAALTLAVLLARGGSVGLLMDLVTLNDSVLTTLALVSLGGSLLTVVTAIAWFVWFDRVLRNVPPLTGEWPDSGRVGAVGWWLVPIIGLVKAPRIVGDVYHRLSVDGTPGLWLLGLWVVTWIGGTVAPWVLARVVGLLPLPFDITLALSDLISLLSRLSYIAAGVCAIALVLSMEHAQRVRLALGGPAAPRPPDVSDADARFRAALVAAARDNAAAKAVERGVAAGSAGPGSAGSGSAGSAVAVDAAGAGSAGSAPVGRSRLGLRSITRPAARDLAGAPAGREDDAALLTPVARPPGTAPMPGSGGSMRRVDGSPGAASPAAMSSIPGAPADPIFIGLPAGSGATGRRRVPGVGGVAVPRLAMVVLIVAVLAATLAGVMLAGPRQHDARTVGDVVDRVIADGLPTPTLGPTLPRPTAAVPTPRPTPTPSPSPEPWIAAAEHLATSTYAEDWTGRMSLKAELRIGDREPLAWTLSVARSGMLEWSKRRIVIPDAGASVQEQVILDRIVWTRENGGEWIRRDRGFGDRPTEPLFGVPDARGLTHLQSFKEGGKMRHEFAMTGANDLLVLEYLRDVGVTGLDRTGATVVTDAAGDPVRAELSYAGATPRGKAKLTVSVEWKDVGGSFSIRSPKEGSPVVD